MFLATDKGLFKVNLEPANNNPLVAPEDILKKNNPVYAVATARTGPIECWVAAVTQDGVYISSDNGKTFQDPKSGPQGEEIQKLAFQMRGGTYLWAGTAAARGQEGQGCLRLRLPTSKNENWKPYGKDWKGGSCNGLAFADTLVLAATHHGGVLFLNTEGAEVWEAPDLATCGLPPRSTAFPFEPVAALATNWPLDEQPKPVVMVSVTRETARLEGEGIYRSQDVGRTYEFLSRKEFDERVTLPRTWLFVSGEHEVKVDYESQEER